MLTDYRGPIVYPVTSNRAPLYLDGSMTSASLTGIVSLTSGSFSATTLLSTASSKTIQVTAADGNPWIASSVYIFNSSGQAATLSLVVVRDKVIRPGAKTNAQDTAGYTLGGQANPLSYEKSLITINVASAAPETTIGITIPARIWQVLESNTSGSSQTGLGIRYWFNLEPLVSM